MKHEKLPCIQEVDMSRLITITQKGDFKYTEDFLERMSSFRQNQLMQVLNKYGEIGVNALSSATPVDTGKTASSWSYDVHISGNSIEIVWSNSNTVRGGALNIAVLIQYGHGTGTGGYVQGRDFINPVMRPLFDEIADKVWEEVTRR